LRRAKALEEAERLDAESRPSHVRDATSGKRILLTAEILDDMPCSMRIQRFWTCCVGVYRWLVVFLSATPSKSRSNLRRVVEGGPHAEPGSLGSVQELWRSTGG
jgi:hypothetical protein